MRLADWISTARSGGGVLAEELPRPLPAHVGLWLDRCLPPEEAIPRKSDGEADEHGNRRRLHDVAIEGLRLSAAPAVLTYRDLFRRHRAAANAADVGLARRVVEAVATSRVLLHPATGSTVTEGSLLLHHTYGVPYLPGSALKGICRHRAMQLQADGVELAGQKDWVNLLFGWTPSGAMGGASGLLDFWDALWVPELPPGTTTFTPLAEDIVNPHHPEYYTAQGQRPPPSDGDAPRPTHLLTIAPKTRFLIVVDACVGGPRGVELLDVVTRLLVLALREDGIGARTRAGYGRLTLDTATVDHSLFGVAKHTRFAQVTFNPGDRSLRATIDGVGGVVAHGPAAGRLLDTLPEDARRELTTKRKKQLWVTWEREGNAHQIVALSVEPTPSGA